MGNALVFVVAGSVVVVVNVCAAVVGVAVVVCALADTEGRAGMLPTSRELETLSVDDAATLEDGDSVDFTTATDSAGGCEGDCGGLDGSPEVVDVTGTVAGGNALGELADDEVADCAVLVGTSVTSTGDGLCFVVLFR